MNMIKACFFEYPIVAIILLKRMLCLFVKKCSYYRLLGYLPPKGTIMEGVENLTVGKSFSFGIDCQFYCQSDHSEGSGKILIGDNVSFNANIMVNADCGGLIEIGNDVLIGPGTIFRSSNHDFSDLSKNIRSQGHSAGKIIIEDDVWVGAGVILLPNIKIGKGSVIAAGAVVTKDVQSYSIYGGIPAKKISER